MIHIDRCIAHYNYVKADNEQRMTRGELGRILWPDVTPQYRSEKLNDWVTGRCTKVDIPKFKQMLRVLRVDANFALGIKRMEGIL